MRDRNILSLLAMLICSNAFGDDTDPKLSVQFATARATVAPRAPDKAVQFPDLTFTLHATASCPAAEVPASISISIADSRITIAPDDDGIFEEEIRVSAKQLGPVVAKDFCLLAGTDELANDEPAKAANKENDRNSGEASDEEPDFSRQLEISGALSAQLSLRCKGENSESISYATAPLNVALVCGNPEQNVPESREIATTSQPASSPD